MIEDNLSLIGQKVKIISPKIRLHWDMKRTIVVYEVCPKYSWTTDITSRRFFLASNCFVDKKNNMYGMHTGKITPVSLTSRKVHGF